MAVLEKASIPPLEQGDVLTRAEFERRYTAMPNLKKAELIDGIVYMASPVRTDSHGAPHVQLTTLLQMYALKRPDLVVADNSTVRLDALNEPQPDLVLMRRNGSARLDADGYISGPPELIAEIASSSASYDLHSKKRSYLRAGVGEYLVWLTLEKRFLFWQYRENDFVEIPSDSRGLLESRIFPGLIIDSLSLLSGDLASALEKLR